MVSLKDKTVLISGASSGIGQACAERFAAAGANLILFARNIARLETIAAEISLRHNVEILVRQLDIREREAVAELINDLPPRWRRVDILVNNAGLALGLEKLHEGDVEEWDVMLDTNVKGLLYLTRKVVPLMLEEELDGQVINIGSIAGIHAYAGGGVYCASKAAVKFISDALRMDVVDKSIRVTNIQPGMVETNFSMVRFDGDQAKADSVYEGIKPLSAEDIADIVLYTASVPPHVQICEVTVTPTHQATGGVVHRRKKG